MRKFEVEIDLPAQELEEFETGDIRYIHAKFYGINWRRLFLMQAQVKNAEVSFAVLDIDTEQYLQVQLNLQANNAEPVFEIQSNIPVMTENKEFLGFFTRKKKQDLVYKNLTQTQVAEQLSLFLHGQVTEMSEQYKQLLHRKMLQEHRLA